MGLLKQLNDSVAAKYIEDYKELSTKELVGFEKNWSYRPVKILGDGVWQIVKVRKPRPTKLWFTILVWWKRLFVSLYPTTWVDNSYYKLCLQDYRVDRVLERLRGLDWEYVTITPAKDSDNYVVNPPGSEKALEGLPEFASEWEAVEVGIDILRTLGGGRLVIHDREGQTKSDTPVTKVSRM